LHGAALGSESTALQGQQVPATQLLQACQLAPGGVSAHSSSHWDRMNEFSDSAVASAVSWPLYTAAQ
jgi:hypothetical protein